MKKHKNSLSLAAMETMKTKHNHLYNSTKNPLTSVQMSMYKSPNANKTNMNNQGENLFRNSVNLSTIHPHNNQSQYNSLYDLYNESNYDKAIPFDEFKDKIAALITNYKIDSIDNLL